MATWSSRRRFLYGGTFLLIILIIIGALSFKFFYKAPTCSDGLKNGDELDIDCGGSCLKLCQSAYLPPKIAWGGGKLEKIADNLYNVASYIENPNTNGAAVDVPYKFSVYDGKGIIITERKGKLTIPAHRNVLAFENAINVQNKIPAKVTFEFLESPQWFKSHDNIEKLAVTDKKYNEEPNGSSLEVTLENRDIIPYRNLRVAAVLYDNEKNAIGFSKTEIDKIGPKDQEIAPFTWPTDRLGKVATIEVLPSAEPVHDR